MIKISSNNVSEVNERRGRTVRSWIGWMACVTVLLGLPARDLALGQNATWEYDPYKIRVLVAIDAPAVGSEPESLRLLRTLEARAYVIGGATWRLKAELAPAELRSEILITPALITTEQISQALPKVYDNDKVLLLGIRYVDGEHHIHCREFDCRTRTFSQLVHRSCSQRGLLAGVAEDALVATFIPIGRVEESRGRDAAVRVRAGGLVYDDFCPSKIRKDDILRCVIRRNDRSGEPRPGGIQEVDWTYVVVRDAQGYMLQCEVLSAMRNPLAGRHSSRLERVAFLVRPKYDSTMIQLVSRDDDRKPLEGYEIFAKKPLAKDDDQKNFAIPLGLTDWQGRIPIPPDDGPLRLVYVKNGSHLIARLPVVVGYERNLVMELDSDDKRLEAEAFVKGMESTVMDVVARREILAARIRRRIEEGNLEGARELLENIKTFETKEDLDLMITDRRQAGLSSNNEREQQRIDQMLAGTRILLSKYLNPETLLALERMVDDAASGGGPAPAEQPPEQAAEAGDATPE